MRYDNGERALVFLIEHPSARYNRREDVLTVQPTSLRVLAAHDYVRRAGAPARVVAALYNERPKKTRDYVRDKRGGVANAPGTPTALRITGLRAAGLVLS